LLLIERVREKKERIPIGSGIPTFFSRPSQGYNTVIAARPVLSGNLS
jgi:hypothetical protein